MYDGEAMTEVRESNKPLTGVPRWQTALALLLGVAVGPIYWHFTHEDSLLAQAVYAGCFAACIGAVLYWFWAVGRLSELCAERYGIERPITPVLFWSTVFSPLFVMNWLFAIQFAWIVCIHNCIQLGEGKGVSWLRSLALPFIAAFCCVAIVEVAKDSSMVPLMMALSVIVQCLSVIFLSRTLARSTAAGLTHQTIEYHPNVAFTRWRQQQWHSINDGWSMASIFLLMAAVIACVFFAGFQNADLLQQIVHGDPTAIFQSKVGLAKQPQQIFKEVVGDLNRLQSPYPLKRAHFVDGVQVPEPTKPLEAISNASWWTSTKADQSTAFGIVQSLLLVSFIGFLFITSKPTHLHYSANGLRFIWRRRWFMATAPQIGWQNLKAISMESIDGHKPKLCLTEKSDRMHRINIDSIFSVEARERLLNAIQKHAPDVPRAPEVMQILEPPADHSYTELWLQALSAPPKRERLQPLWEGSSLRGGRYKVVSELGSGGQGQAYLCADTFNSTEVVLKEFILPVYVDTKVRRSALEQFENEAKILRQLDHPQIVKLIDFFIEDHRGYLVLEHIQGSSLRQIVDTDGPLLEEEVRSLALQMCEILSYLHGLAEPVVHRDFTPENLILRSDGTLKLIDFNVAKQMVESTVSGTVVGKHAYLPPEQFRGMPECRSDIYAMGATLHFLLTGMEPEPISVSHPKKIITAVSDELDKIISRATALDAEKRYACAEEIKQELSVNIGAMLAMPTGEVIYVPSKDQRCSSEQEDEVPAVWQTHPKV
jgi:tRNA A-37 threonylcarbamoyl transferase component Bud32